MQSLTETILKNPGARTRKALEAWDSADQALDGLGTFHREGIAVFASTEWKQKLLSIYEEFLRGKVDYRDVVAATARVVEAARERWRGALARRSAQLRSELSRVQSDIHAARAHGPRSALDAETLAIHIAAWFLLFTIIAAGLEIGSRDTYTHENRFPAMMFWAHSVWISVLLGVGIPIVRRTCRSTVAESMEAPLRDWVPALEQEITYIEKLRAAGGPVAVPALGLPGKVPPGPRLGRRPRWPELVAVGAWLPAAVVGIAVVLILRSWAESTSVVHQVAPAAAMPVSTSGGEGAESISPQEIEESILGIRRRFIETNKRLTSMEPRYVMSPPAIGYFASGESESLPQKIVWIRRGDSRRGISEYYLRAGQLDFVYAHGRTAQGEWSERLYYHRTGSLIRRLADGAEQPLAESWGVSDAERDVLRQLLQPYKAWHGLNCQGCDPLEWLRNELVED
jgi:hypothetical protein